MSTSIFGNYKFVTLTYFLNSFLFTKKVGQKCTNFLDFMDSPSQTYIKWPLRTLRTAFVPCFVSLKIVLKIMEFLKCLFCFFFCLQVKGEKVIVTTIKCDLKRLSLIFNWCRDLWCQIFIIAHQSLGNVSTITPLPRNMRF